MISYTSKGERMRPTGHKESKGNIFLIQLDECSFHFSYIDEKGVMRNILLNAEETKRVREIFKKE